MGVSTDGILFWGFTFAGEDHRHIDPPWEGHWSSWEWKAEKELKEKLTALGIEIDSHCSSEYAEYYITLTETKHTASRGYPEEITQLEVPKDGRDRLQKACALLCIEWQEPKWWLASYWG